MTPAPVPMQRPRVELDEHNRIRRAFIPSLTTPGQMYEIVRTADGGWVHADSLCPAWGHKITCHHLEALRQLDREGGLK